MGNNGNIVYAVSGIYFAKIQKQTGKMWIFSGFDYIRQNIFCVLRILFGKHIYKSVLFC